MQQAEDLLAENWGKDIPGGDEPETPRKRKRGKGERRKGEKKKGATNGNGKKRHAVPSLSSESSEEEERGLREGERDERGELSPSSFPKKRFHFADPAQTIDLDLGKMARVYHTVEDQTSGFGVSKGKPVPLVDAHGKKSYAAGGGAFIKTVAISNHMKNRAGIESINSDAAKRVARYGEDCVAALVSQAIICCRDRGQKTVTPDDVQHAASLMGVHNLIRC
jgi:histone H3/H4